MEQEKKIEEFDIQVVETKINQEVAKTYQLSDFLKIELSKFEIPSPSCSKRNDWVTWNDDKSSLNSFFNVLHESLKKCPIHNSAVRYKASLYAGQSWKIINQNEISEKEVKEVNSFLSKINGHGESLIDVNKKFCMDASTTGNAYFQIIWNKAKTKIVEVYHIHANTLAPQIIGDNGKINNYYFSSDWSRYRQEAFKPVPIPTFDYLRPGGRQIIPFRLNVTPGDLYFGVPDYLPALPLIELTEEIAYFWLNYIQSGFFGNTILTFPNGIPSDEIKNKITNDLKKLYTGKNRQHLYLNFAMNKDQAPIISNLSNTADLDKAFTVLIQIVNEALSTAHKITSQRLFGITAGSTQIGQKDELIQAWQILMHSTIFPVQIEIEKIINNILEINGWSAKIELVESTPFVDDKAIFSVLTSELSDEQKYANLIELYSIEPERALKMVRGSTLPALPAPKSLPPTLPQSKENETANENE